ncbi:glycosyltransferase, partial [Winogradskyella sp.]|uniref:glycosyltransferase n=1 Tax=Winogradskyella sp. TaxID=1883156 RepID=UPI003F6BA8E8
SLRLHKLGYKTTLIKTAYVFHKRRVSWLKFYKQVNKFGMVRPILNLWHPDSKSLVYWFPTVFNLGFLLSIILTILGESRILFLYIAYFIVAFVLALFNTKNVIVAFQAIFAIIIQFFGYGYGFLKSTVNIQVLRKDPKDAFPELFFK